MGAIAERVIFEPDPYIATKDAHAIAVLTEWPQYIDLDYKAIYKSMIQPSFIFDGRNLLNHENLFQIGFNVYPLGKPHRTHFSS